MNGSAPVALWERLRAAIDWTARSVPAWGGS